MPGRMGKWLVHNWRREQIELTGVGGINIRVGGTFGTDWLEDGWTPPGPCSLPIYCRGCVRVLEGPDAKAELGVGN